MIKFLVPIGILSSLVGMRPALGQDLPSPPVEARLYVSNPTPYVKEIFTVTLEIISRDIEISSRLDLANLPDRDVMRILGSFEALTVQREREGGHEITRRRYRAKARAMEPKEISFTPVLRLTSRERVRSFFGSTIEERPLSLQVPEIKIAVQPLPPPPDDFSGIIGDFSISMEASPLEIETGDLVTIKTTLQGNGWIPDDAIPAIRSSSFLRAYRVRQSQDTQRAGRYVFHQTVVPMDKSLQELPSIPFVWFNTESGEYERDVFGPFALAYVEEPIEEQPDPTETADEQELIRRMGANRNRVQLPDATRAFVAPSTASMSTFTIPPDITIRVLETYQNWALVDFKSNRGWIPLTALAAP